MKVHQPTAAVRKSFSEAQQQAAAMVVGQPTPWNAATLERRRSPLWIGVAAVSVVASGVMGWLGVDWFLASPRPALSDSAARAVPPSTPPAPLPVMNFAPVTAPSSLAVTRKAGVIRIESSNTSLEAAVRALAQATRTNVRGAEALASVTTPITLNWQGRDAVAAWDALLGRFASTAISCAGATCDLWIASVNAPRATAGAQQVDGRASSGESVPAPAVVAAPPPQQSSEDNTETN